MTLNMSHQKIEMLISATFSPTVQRRFNFFPPISICRICSRKPYFRPRSDKSYLDFLNELYSDPDVWSQQETNIQNMLDWAEGQDAQVIGLVWPDLAELEKSQPLVDQVESVFEDQGHMTINLGEVLTGQDSTTLVASPFDNHANAYTHGIVGEQLVEAIATLDEID